MIFASRVRKIIYFAVLLLCAAQLRAYCPIPEPSVGAELFQREPVFVGKVLGGWNQIGTSVGSDPADTESYVAGWLWKVEVSRAFRGCKVGDKIYLYSENADERYDLKIGRNFLLFGDSLDPKREKEILKSPRKLLNGSPKGWADQGPKRTQKLYEISDCDRNSMMGTAKTDESIHNIEKALADNAAGAPGTVQGQVVARIAEHSGSYSFRGVSGVGLVLENQATKVTFTSGTNGNFEVAAPAGNYQLKSASSDVKLAAHDYSFDDPQSIKLEAGGGASVQVEATKQTQP